jgi:hypothetical protein
MLISVNENILSKLDKKLIYLKRYQRKLKKKIITQIFLHKILWIYSLYIVSKSYGDKILSEHQSKEVEEIESFAHLHPFGIKPTKFLSRLQYYFIPLYNEKNLG